jgi:hypothetical protein
MGTTDPGVTWYSQFGVAEEVFFHDLVKKMYEIFPEDKKMH